MGDYAIEAVRTQSIQTLRLGESRNRTAFGAFTDFNIHNYPGAGFAGTPRVEFSEGSSTKAPK